MKQSVTQSSLFASLFLIKNRSLNKELKQFVRRLIFIDIHNQRGLFADDWQFLLRFHRTTISQAKTYFNLKLFTKIKIQKHEKFLILFL